MKIDLHIESLVLEGFPPHQRRSIAEALRAELARRLAAGGLPANLRGGGDLPRLDGGTFEHAPGASPRLVGERIAGAIDRGWRR